VEARTFDSYPWWIVVVSLGASLLLYALGTFILSGFGLLAAALYLGFCVFAEVSVLRGSCRHCYYYGKVCAFGRGRLCAALYPRGEPERFVCREPSLRDILPDILVAAIPVVGGVVLLVLDFDWALLLAVVAFVVIATVGTGVVRGRLACAHCAQRELGCPAEQLFAKRAS
jgi:hypothetical protein